MDKDYAKLARDMGEMAAQEITKAKSAALAAQFYWRVAGNKIEEMKWTNILYSINIAADHIDIDYATALPPCGK